MVWLKNPNAFIQYGDSSGSWGVGALNGTMTFFRVDSNSNTISPRSMFTMDSSGISSFVNNMSISGIYQLPTL